MVTLKDNFICVFCDERQRTENGYIIADRVGICRKCHSSLAKTAPSMPYPGTRSISYIISPFEYADSLRQAILDFKFNNCRAYAPLFAEMMKEYLETYDIWEKFDYIVPVPLHAKRLRERGYNQAELIAEYVEDYLGIPMDAGMLSRIRATKRQSSLKRFDRIKNVKDAFKCQAELVGESILLFDDICTTGSTLQSCADALKQKGAGDICALTLSIHIVENLPVIMY